MPFINDNLFDEFVKLFFKIISSHVNEQNEQNELLNSPKNIVYYFDKPNLENSIAKCTIKQKTEEEKSSSTNANQKRKETMALLQVKGLSLGKTKRKDGRYLGRYKINGKYESFYAKSYEALENIALDIITGKKQLKNNKKTLTYGQWVEKWLETYHKKKTRPHVFKNDTGIFKNHILPHLANKPLNLISGFDVQEIINKCPFSRQRQIVADKLIASLRKAYELDLLKKDITKAVEKPSHESASGRALNSEEEKILLNAIKGDKLEQYITFILFSGLRRNEALGLQWKHLDFEKNNIFVEQQVTMDNTITSKLKTKTSKRMVKMFPQIKKMFLPLSKSKNSKERLFNFSPDYVSRKFTAICSKLNLNFTIKGARTTFATRCEKMGISRKVVQAWLGHSKLDTTANIYQITDSELIDLEFIKVKKFFKL